MATYRTVRRMPSPPRRVRLAETGEATETVAVHGVGAASIRDTSVFRVQRRGAPAVLA